MATDAELEAAAETSLANGIKRLKVRNGNEVEYGSPTEQLKALLILRGLQSSKRGLNVGQIDNDR
jgi:hypothetical protein